MNTPEFSMRTSKEKYQIRFWSTPERYQDFCERVEKEGLLIQDVFNDFMVWFIKESLTGRILKGVIKK